MAAWGGVYLGMRRCVVGITMLCWGDRCLSAQLVALSVGYAHRRWRCDLGSPRLSSPHFCTDLLHPVGVRRNSVLRGGVESVGGALQ